jgi:hypothetical protein
MIEQTIRLQFEYDKKKFDFEIKPEETDWWTSSLQHGKVLDIHYCEDYNKVYVYKTRQKEGFLITDYSELIYSQKILKIMEFDDITIHLYYDGGFDDKGDYTGDTLEVYLGSDNGDDMYPDVELSDDVKKKIEAIRKIAWS